MIPCFDIEEGRKGAMLTGEHPSGPQVGTVRWRGTRTGHDMRDSGYGAMDGRDYEGN
jgi:hypothetical protein